VGGGCSGCVLALAAAHRNAGEGPFALWALPTTLALPGRCRGKETSSHTKNTHRLAHLGRAVGPPGAESAQGGQAAALSTLTDWRQRSTARTVDVRARAEARAEA
jgi:hypothetical protein